MSKVTIIMTTYNGEKYVMEQVESILSSSYQDFELLIYDDGSKDATWSILEQQEKLYKGKIHVFQNERNLGVTHNFLQAICHSTAEYIMLCDQDDVWKPNKISHTLKKMQQMEEKYKKNLPIAVFTDATVVNQDLKVLHDSFFKASHLDPFQTDLSHLLMENKLIGCTVMINAALKTIIKEHKLPQLARFHDGWIALIAAAFGRIGYLEEATLLYRQHGQNVVGNVRFLAYLKNRITSIRRQKEALLAQQSQAGEFCALYKNILTKDNIHRISIFANLHKVNFITRKYQVIHFRYLKTGLIRNVGLMIIV